MSTSILNDIKHMLGLLPEDTVFDQDIILWINGAFSTLTQLGVGPVNGYAISGVDNTWDEFYTDQRLNGVPGYIFLCVKMQFDPPKTGFNMQAMERQKQEQEIRLNMVAEFG